MRRSALPGLSVVLAGLLSGCTGTGVFIDHTTQWFGAKPNAPAGNSETFARIRGERIDVQPLLPEQGNVWPADTGPGRTMQELQKQQGDEQRPSGSMNPTALDRANRADRGLPAPGLPPAPPGRLRSPTVNTPNGPSVDITGPGTGRGYRQLGSPTPGGSGILVPNGNGTSTLIAPDGSVQTVPTRP